MDIQDRIEINPAVLAGKPVIKGTRIAVEFIIELLAQDWPESEILKNYPQLRHEDILAALNYSAEMLKQETVYSLP